MHRSRCPSIALGLLLPWGCIAHAETVWPTPISTAVTWSAAASPHTWDAANLQIASGGSVSIEAGAVVIMPSGSSITVDPGAQILALGSSDAPIRIGGASQSVPGGVIHLTASLTSQFRFCHFSNLAQIRVDSASPQGNHLFEHCVFRKFTDHAIQINAAPARVLHCIFLDQPTELYGVQMNCSAAFSDETCPTIWYNAFRGNGLWITAPNWTTVPFNHIDFFRHNRVTGGIGVLLSGDKYPNFQNFRLLDCDLGSASPSVRVFSTPGWDGSISGSIERCGLSTLARSSLSVDGVTNLANNYWGTTNMDTIAAALFGGALAPDVALPIAVTHPFPQADVDGSDDGNQTRQADADLVKQAIVGLTPLSSEAAAIADVDGNGVVDTRDALLIESYVNGLIWKLPVP